MPRAVKRNKKAKKYSEDSSLSLKGKTDITGIGRVPGSTRHPFATKVAVSSDKGHAQCAGDLYEDPNAGNFSGFLQEKYRSKLYSEETKLVRVKNGFWMARLLITQELYLKVMGNNPSFYDPSINENVQNYPVNNVSWLDAVSFCKSFDHFKHDSGGIAGEL